MSRQTNPRPAPAAAPPAEPTDLYDRDFVAWLDAQVALLRTGRLNQLDAANLAEELDDMGKSQRQALRNRFVVLLLHLLKYHLQPDQRSGSWRGTIIEQRQRIGYLLEDSSSLKRLLEMLLAQGRAYAEAVKRAVGETAMPVSAFPPTCPYTLAEILDSRFWPGPGPHPEFPPEQ